jgi:hypothetical protein
LCSGGKELAFDIRSITDSPNVRVNVAIFCDDVKVLVSKKARDTAYVNQGDSVHQGLHGPMGLLMLFEGID